MYLSGEDIANVRLRSVENRTDLSLTETRGIEYPRVPFQLLVADLSYRPESVILRYVSMSFLTSANCESLRLDLYTPLFECGKIQENKSCSLPMDAGVEPSLLLNLDLSRSLVLEMYGKQYDRKVRVDFEPVAR